MNNSPCCEKCEGDDRGSAYDGYEVLCLKRSCPCHSNSQEKQEKWTSTACSSPEHRLLGCRTLYYKGSLFDCYEKLRAFRQPSIEDYKCIEHKGQFGNAYLDCEFCKRTPPSEAWEEEFEVMFPPRNTQMGKSFRMEQKSFIRQKIAEAREAGQQEGAAETPIHYALGYDHGKEDGRAAALKECLEVIEGKEGTEYRNAAAYQFVYDKALSDLKQQFTSLLGKV